MSRVLLGMALMWVWQWAGRHAWKRWRAYGSEPLPPELVRRSQ